MNVRKYLAAYLPYRRFAKDYAWMRTCLSPQQGKAVLMVNFTDWAPRTKLDGVIAKGLQLRGYRPFILTKRAYTWSHAYFRAIGITDLLFFDDYLKEAASTLSPEETSGLLETNLSFQKLYSYHEGEIGIGRHVLSSVVRQLKSGSVSFEDPDAIRLLREFFPLSRKSARAAELVFKELAPSIVLFSEKGYTPYGEIFDTALSHWCNTVQYLHAHRSDLLLLKRYTLASRFQHHFSLSRESWKKVQETPWREEEEERFLDTLKKSYAEGTWFNRKFLLEGKKLKDPETVRRELRLDPTRKTAVIFSHVLWDATFFFGENLFPDYEQWLIATVREACKNTSVNWLIKLHPDYVWKMREMRGPSASPRDALALEAELGPLPSHIQIVPPDTDISTYSFFAITDYCITVRGTIGIEAPCFGIPVITAGTGRYSNLGFTNDSKTAEEYLAKIRGIQGIPPLTKEETTLARKHAYGLFELRPLPFTTCELLQNTVRGNFGQDAVIRAHSLDDLRSASDLQALLDFVLESREEDYLRSS